MATYSKIVLSESTDGVGILVDDDATAGKLIHEGSGTAADYDEVWIYASNISAADKKLTIEWGKVTVEWWTHKIKDLHQNDFIMAAKTDKFYSDTPRATA